VRSRRNRYPSNSRQPEGPVSAVSTGTGLTLMRSEANGVASPP
jgi:hypothetical protein